MTRSNLAPSVKGLATTAAKIRALAEQGHARADIARALGVRYQQVRNVLLRAEAKRTEGGKPAKAIASHGHGRPTKIRVGADRRIALPSALSDALGLRAGDVLFARVGEGEILLLTREAATRRVQALARQYVPASVSLVDELLQERRREAEAERRHG